jgi:hypothetical protein
MDSQINMTQAAHSTQIGPKRKQCAFVMEEEMEFFREDRAGTPHISELQADEEVMAPLGVEELAMVGGLVALEKPGEEEFQVMLRTMT